LERAKKAYEKAWREAEKAHDLFQKADADLNLSRAEVQKHQMNDSMKSHQCEEAKNEYAAQLQKTNELQVIRRFAYPFRSSPLNALSFFKAFPHSLLRLLSRTIMKTF
jgi:hypothetical protein